MKKIIGILLSASMIAGVFAAAPVSASAAAKAVRLKSSSATLKITKKNGKTKYGKTRIKLVKASKVKIKKITFKSSNKKVAKVNKHGTVTAKKKGSAKITIKVSCKLKNKSCKMTFTFKVKVKDKRKNTKPVPVNPVEEPTKPFTYGDSVKPLNELPAINSNDKKMTDKDFLKKLSAFSNKLYAMTSKDENGNYSMSPVSIYMALSMLYSVGDDGVKSDIESLVGMNDKDIAKTGELFLSLVKKYTSFGKTVSQLNLTNTIWLDNNQKADSDTLKMLADKLYCGAYEAPFADDNKTANAAVREFIKRQTNGLIDQDFDLQPDTVFALINTLYFKDIWSFETESLQTSQRYFSSDKGLKKCEFLTGRYVEGKVAETETSYYFYTTTAWGYKVKFVLPKEGKTLKEAMSADNLNEINLKSDFADKNDLTEHQTRCIFPSFKIESDTPLKKIFAANNVLGHAFTNYTSPLVKSDLCVSDIKHKTVIDVNKKGVEGAAVTVIMSKNSAAVPTKKIVYHDFVLNRNFGFIITDPSDVILFEGQVTDPQPKVEAVKNDDLDFSLKFGVAGQSSYDSKTGKLVKTSDTIDRNPEEYKNILILSEKQKSELKKAFSELKIEDYPDSYDPFADENGSVMSTPSQTIVLRIGNKTVNCPNISLGGEGKTEKGKKFMSAVNKITDILTSSEEWKVLPDYEAFYY